MRVRASLNVSGRQRLDRGVGVVARPRGGKSEYLIGRKNGLCASVSAGRIIAVQHALLPAVQSRLLPAVQSPAAPGDTVVLRNVRIVSIAPAPAWAGGAPQESVAFEYGALTVTSARRLR
ncbi:MAG TPA: hypothetical protein VK679_09555 [Gemmatimonadaceae bacterium]|jgi:hypothetical protein|nr:hypothetical protein [Gemmatimonadaceae bacterium]